MELNIPFFILAVNLKLDDTMQYLPSINLKNKVLCTLCDISLHFVFNNIKAQHTCPMGFAIDLTLNFKSLCLGACRNKDLSNCKTFMGSDIRTLNLTSTHESFGNMTSLSLFFLAIVTTLSIN